MELREKLKHDFYLLEKPYFIEKVEMDRSNDYWLGRSDNEERRYLGTSWDEANKKAEEFISSYYEV